MVHGALGVRHTAPHQRAFLKRGSAAVHMKPLSLKRLAQAVCRSIRGAEAARRATAARIQSLSQGSQSAHRHHHPRDSANCFRWVLGPDVFGPKSEEQLELLRLERFCPPAKEPFALSSGNRSARSMSEMNWC